MSLKAVIGRELRCAARKPITWRVRLLTPALSMLMCALGLWFATFFGATPIPGRELFFILTWITFGSIALTAAAFISDSISEEKREGTLPLLFLTNLRARQIALGKLFSNALPCFYALLGTLPMLFLPVMMGGAGVKQVLFAIVALLTTLFFALSFGLMISAFMKNAWRASGLTVSGLVLFCAGLPALAAHYRFNLREPVISDFLLIFSPAAMVQQANAAAFGLPSSGFWPSVACQVIMGGSFIILTCLTLQFSWKDKAGGRRSVGVRNVLTALTYGKGEARSRLRNQLLRVNPILWLSARTRWHSAGFGVFVFTVLCLAWYLIGKVPVVPGSSDAIEVRFVGLMIALFFLQLVLMAKVAAIGAARFSQDRRTGALELILSTPLTLKEIIRGQWLAILKTLWTGIVPILLLHQLQIQWLCQILTEELGKNVYVWSGPELLVQHLMGGEVENHFEPFILPFMLLMGGVLGVCCTIAVGWLSMWVALRMTNGLRAPWLALIAVLVTPWPLFIIVMATLDYHDLFPHNRLDRFLLNFGSIFLLVLGNALFWALWSRRQLYTKFRAAATDRFSFEKRRWWRRNQGFKEVLQP